MTNRAARMTTLFRFLAAISLCFAGGAQAADDDVKNLVKQLQAYRDDTDEFIRDIDAKIGTQSAAQAYLLSVLGDGSENLEEEARTIGYLLFRGWRSTTSILIADPTKSRQHVNSLYLHFINQRNRLDETLAILKQGRIVRVLNLKSVYASGAQRYQKEKTKVRSAVLECLPKELRIAMSIFREESAARKAYLKLSEDLRGEPEGLTLRANWIALQNQRQTQETNAYKKCLADMGNIVYTRQAPVFEKVVTLPACAEPLVEYTMAVDAFIAELESNEAIPDSLFNRLITWQNNFKYRRDGFDAILDNVAGQIEAQSEPIPTLLKALDGEASREELAKELKEFGKSNSSAKKLSETALEAPLLATAYASVKLLQQMRDWPNRDQNQAMYEWLLEYNENGRAKPIDSEIEGFVSRHTPFFKQFTGITPPTRSALGAQFEPAMTRYLKTYGQPLFYFFGRLEEDAPSAFPRYRITRDARYRPGYYKKVLKKKLVGELKLLNEKLKMLQCASLARQNR